MMTEVSQIKDLVGLCRSNMLSAELGELLGPIRQWLGTNRLETFERKIGPVNRFTANMSDAASALYSSARGFHVRAGTLTPDVELNLQKVKSGNSVRLSHQPNFGAYCKLLFLFPALDALARSLDAGAVYLFNDLDLAWNDRFRRATYPSITMRAGYEYIRMPIGRRSRSKVGFTVDSPGNPWFSEVSDQLSRILSIESKLLGKSDDSSSRLNQILGDLHYAVCASESLTDMTAILLSRFLTLRLGIPTVFAPAHDVWRRYGLRESLSLFARWPLVQEVQKLVSAEFQALSLAGFEWRWLENLRMAPYWSICECGRRIALEFYEINSTMLVGRCDACRFEARFEMHKVHRRMDSEEWAPPLLPRIGMQNLVISGHYGFSSGVTYLSSAPHTLVYGVVGERLGMSLLPQIFADPRGSFGTRPELSYRDEKIKSKVLGLEEAARIIRAGRASSLYVSTHVPFADLTKAGMTWIEDLHFESPIVV